MKIFGYDFEEIEQAQQGKRLVRTINTRAGDYGADPLGEGMFRMVPSGDIVNNEERAKRLAH